MSESNAAVSRLAAGERIRAELLGPEFVARERQARTDFDGPFQELVTEFLWGHLWMRDGLERKTRALLDVAILGALGGRAHGVAVHVEAALRAGCTDLEIRETLLHVSVLAGVSAGSDAFKASKATIAGFKPEPIR